jgi:hypothetical protein
MWLYWQDKKGVTMNAIEYGHMERQARSLLTLKTKGDISDADFKQEVFLLAERYFGKVQE